MNSGPAAMQAITAAVLAGVSDLVAQKLAARKAPVNWRRTAAMVAFGGVWSGPSNHFWQIFVERVFRGQSGGSLLMQKVRRTPQAVVWLARGSHVW